MHPASPLPHYATTSHIRIRDAVPKAGTAALGWVADIPISCEQEITRPDGHTIGRMPEIEASARPVSR